MKKEEINQVRKLILEVLEEKAKKVELEELRKKVNQPKETRWTLMARGFWEYLPLMVIDWIVWFLLLIVLGVF